MTHRRNLQAKARTQAVKRMPLPLWVMILPLLLALAILARTELLHG